MAWRNRQGGELRASCEITYGSNQAIDNSPLLYPPLYNAAMELRNDETEPMTIFSSSRTSSARYRSATPRSAMQSHSRTSQELTDRALSPRRERHKASTRGMAAWTAGSPVFPGQNMAASGYDYIAPHEPMHREPINGHQRTSRDFVHSFDYPNRNTVTNSESASFYGGRLVA